MSAHNKAKQEAPMIYLDNNATTIMPNRVVQKVMEWMNKGNPSADYRTARECNKMMKSFRDFIANHCGFISYEEDAKYSQNEMKRVYQITITSCASESNNTIIRSAVEAYGYHTGYIPHVITSAIEHKSLLDCVKHLAITRKIELTFVQPNKMGFIEPEKISSAIRPNTCLISIMSANNETGAINNIKKIGEIAHKNKVPFHTDCVQTFGKFAINPVADNVDAFSVSFHKLHGPPGIGILVIKRQLIEGYHMLPEICGSQNCGFRGGTENIPGIAGAFEGTKYTWEGRQAKNSRMLALKKSIVRGLSEKAPCQTYTEYLMSPSRAPVFMVFLSLTTKDYLPNTLLLSIVKPNAPYVCNVSVKKRLEKMGIITSIGSACNTSSDKASHVLTAMGVDALIKKGALRITIGDETTGQQCAFFVNAMLDILEEVKVGSHAKK